MSFIVLNGSQADVLREASGPVEIRDEQGAVLARVLPPSEETLVSEARRRLAANGPRYPAAEVQARLLRLEEISREEQLDDSKVKELLRRMRAGEKV